MSDHVTVSVSLHLPQSSPNPPHEQPQTTERMTNSVARLTQPTCHLLLLVLLRQGLRPLVFFTRVGKPSIRMAVSPGAGAEKKSADK